MNDLPYEVLLERIVAASKAIATFATRYMETPAEDTSPDERQRLAEVSGLLDQALERFQ